MQALGGAKYMVLSHKDDVADHAEWAAALGLQRIIHADEVTARQGTRYAVSTEFDPHLLCNTLHRCPIAPFSSVDPALGTNCSVSCGALNALCNLAVSVRSS